MAVTSKSHNIEYKSLLRRSQNENKERSPIFYATDYLKYETKRAAEASRNTCLRSCPHTNVFQRFIRSVLSNRIALPCAEDVPNGVLCAVLWGNTEDLATAAQREGLKGVAVSLTADERWGMTPSQLDPNATRRTHTWTPFTR